MPFRPSGHRSVGTGAPGMGRLWRPNPAEISRYGSVRKNRNAPAVIRGASAWYDLRDLTSTTQQTLPNRNNPSATAAQFGSTSGSDTNAPTLIPFEGGAPFVRIPNAAGNYLGSSLTAPVDGQTYVEVVARLRPRSLAGNITFGGTASTHLGVYLRTDGKLNIYHLNTTTAGAVGNAPSSAAIPSYAVDTWYWVKLRLTQATAVCEYWYSTESVTDPAQVTWIALGAPQTGTRAGEGFATTSQTIINVGSYSTGLAPGAPFDIQHFAINWSGQAWKSWTCDTGQSTNNTLTVVRATSGLTTAVVTRPLAMEDGTDDYLLYPSTDTPTFDAATGKFTVLQVARLWVNGGGAFSRVWASESATNRGAFIAVSDAAFSYRAFVGGTTTFIATATKTFTQGALHTVAMVCDSGAAAIYTNEAGLSATTSYAGVGTIVFADPRSGNSPAGGPAEQELYATIIFPGRALTAAELDAASAYLLGSYS